MNLTEFLHGNIVLIRFGKEAGTAFFYSKSKESEQNKIGWVKVDGTFLVTAKHCLINDKTNEIIDNLEISYVYKNETGEFIPFHLNLTKEQIKKGILLSNDFDVDIALIDLSLINIEGVGGDGTARMIKHNSFSSRQNYLKDDYIKVDTGTSIIVTGYPNNYYDTYNHFPISKSGIISSGWGLNFDDMPYFLIDVQLFPVSSGSPIYTKPSGVIVKDGKILTNKVPQTVLLGIYIGEWQQKNIKEVRIEGKKEQKIEIYESMGFGKACYSSFIDEIVDNPINFDDYIKL